MAFNKYEITLWMRNNLWLLINMAIIIIMTYYGYWSRSNKHWVQEQGAEDEGRIAPLMEPYMTPATNSLATIPPCCTHHAGPSWIRGVFFPRSDVSLPKAGFSPHEKLFKFLPIRILLFRWPNLIDPTSFIQIWMWESGMAERFQLEQ